MVTPIRSQVPIPSFSGAVRHVYPSAPLLFGPTLALALAELAAAAFRAFTAPHGS